LITEADYRAMTDDPQLSNTLVLTAGAFPVMVGVAAILLRAEWLFAVAGALAALYVPAALVISE
jgi:hypothetical protein